MQEVTTGMREKAIKLLNETKPIVCLPWEILNYKIFRARNPEVRGSNPGSGSSFSLEII